MSDRLHRVESVTTTLQCYACGESWTLTYDELEALNDEDYDLCPHCNGDEIYGEGD